MKRKLHKKSIITRTENTKTLNVTKCLNYCVRLFLIRQMEECYREVLLVKMPLTLEKLKQF